MIYILVNATPKELHQSYQKRRSWVYPGPIIPVAVSTAKQRPQHSVSTSTCDVLETVSTLSTWTMQGRSCIIWHGIFISCGLWWLIQEKILNHIWLVVYLPLWKIWLRHLGWWHSQYMESHKNHVPNHQPVIDISSGL